MAERCLLPYRAFERLVKEIAHEAKTVEHDHRWEKDAIVALQLLTEHVLVMVFEMTYFFLYTTTQLTSRNKLTIHTKCQTIMPYDMQLLRNLWQRISPESAIGADDADTVRAKRVWQEQEQRHIASWKESVQAQVNHA